MTAHTDISEIVGDIAEFESKIANFSIHIHLFYCPQRAFPSMNYADISMRLIVVKNDAMIVRRTDSRTDTHSSGNNWNKK